MRANFHRWARAGWRRRFPDDDRFPVTIRLSDDIIGDDGVINASAKTDLGSNADYREERVQPCPGATFLCAPVSLFDPAGIALQYRRMAAEG